MNNSQMGFFFDMPEENLAKFENKRALMKAPLSLEDKLALDSWNVGHEIDLELMILTRSIKILKTQTPAHPEWKWEAAWVFAPTLNFQPGEHQVLSFEAVAANCLVYINQFAEIRDLGDFDEVTCVSELRQKILDDMPEENALAIIDGSFKKNNPYPCDAIDSIENDVE